jgi:hypothetical protein
MDSSSTAASNPPVPTVTAGGPLPMPPAPTSTSTGDMPAVYIQPETPSSAQPQTADIFDTEFLCGLSGILKVVEMIFSLITFICACADYSPFTARGGGWVQFVAITAFMLTGVVYLIRMFRMTPKFTDKIPFKFSEFCYYAIYSLFYFIAAIVAACNAHLGGAVVAATVFAFFSLFVYGVDAVMGFIDWRNSSEGPYFSSIMASSTT